MPLPDEVFGVSNKVGVKYYYFQARRGTKLAGPRVSLGRDPQDPEFWRRAAQAKNEAYPDSKEAVEKLEEEKARANPKSVAMLINSWMGNDGSDGLPETPGSAEWMSYEASTQKDYAFYAAKIKTFLGAYLASDIKASHALLLRDLFDTAGAANYVVTIGKTIFKWGIPRDFASVNPFREIKALETEDDGHWPWPDWALDLVDRKAPPDLARFVYLAYQSGQRESDVVRLGAGAREGNGLWIRPLKTRKKRRKAFFVPMTGLAVQRVGKWESDLLTFHLIRRKEPVRYAPGSVYVLSPAGNPYTTTGIRSRWNRWLETKDGQELLERWDKWERAQRTRDGETVADDASLRPTIHGLRSTAVVHRRLAGYRDEDISNDIGMSIQMVRRYSRFIDQKAAAEENIVRLEHARKAKAVLTDEKRTRRERG